MHNRRPQHDVTGGMIAVGRSGSTRACYPDGRDLYCEIGSFVVLRRYPQPRVKAIHRRSHPATVGVSRSRFQAEASLDTTSPRVG